MRGGRREGGRELDAHTDFCRNNKILFEITRHFLDSSHVSKSSHTVELRVRSKICMIYQ